ncbi:MAG: porin [Microgenomates group bacterium]
MKKILLATSILAATSGFAAAEVTLSGDARMGVTNKTTSGDFEFTSRARVKFTLAGESDSGLSFGGSFRADNAAASTTVTIAPGADLVVGTPDDIVSTSTGGGAINGAAGSVFVSGAFGSIAMGDNDSAVQAAVGQVSATSLTGLGDLNEVSHIGNGPTPNVLYSGTFGAASVYASAGQVGSDDMGVGVGFAAGAYNFGLGWGTDGTNDEIAMSAAGTFGAVSAKAVIIDHDVNGSEWALSATGTFSGAAVTGFYRDSDVRLSAYGLGASYDLGGGLSVVGGIAKAEGLTSVADFGVSMSF